MKILLVNPPIKNIIDTELPEVIRKEVGVLPPLGLMYVASYLAKNNPKNEIEILDTITSNMEREEIKRYIADFMPEVVGITVHTHNLLDVFLLVQDIKLINPAIHISIGGPHVNIFPEESVMFSGVDSVVVGEGEITFSELIECITEKGNLHKVKGILFKHGQGFIRTKPRAPLEDIDRLPFPKREKIKKYSYRYALSHGYGNITTMISSRGCPYNCIFCSTPRGMYRVRSADDIVDEMQKCLESGIDEIHFVDDTFGIDGDHVLGICNEIEKRNLRIKWGIRSRVDGLNQDLLYRLKESGCYRINLGVETSTDDGLVILKKGITLRQIKDVFKWTKEAGIAIIAYFILGCPHEKTRSDIERTIDFAINLDPDYAMFNLLALYPGTELYNQGIREGVIKNDYWGDFIKHPRKDFLIPFWEKWFSRDELIRFLMMAYRKFYLRPRFIHRILKNNISLKRGIDNLRIGVNILFGRR